MWKADSTVDIQCEDVAYSKRKTSTTSSTSWNSEVLFSFSMTSVTIKKKKRWHRIEEYSCSELFTAYSLKSVNRSRSATSWLQQFLAERNCTQGAYQGLFDQLYMHYVRYMTALRFNPTVGLPWKLTPDSKVLTYICVFMCEKKTELSTVTQVPALMLMF